jgi:hypothetical protein
VTVKKMNVVNVLKLVAYGIAIAAVDLAIEAVDANKAFVTTVTSLL